MVLVAARTTTELHNNPGWQLPFVPVFQPGLSIRDKCECLFCPGSYSTGTNAFFHKQKKIGWLAPASAFASRFSKSKNLSKTVISKSRSKQSQNQDLKFITHHASVLHTTHNTQVICLSHTQENTRSKIIDSHHKDSQTKKINNRARVRRRPCPRRPTAAGVPAPPALGHALRWRLGRPQPAPVWAAAAGRLCTRPRRTRQPAPVRAVPAGLQRRQLAVLHARRPAPPRWLAGPRPCPCGGSPVPARAGEGRIEGREWEGCEREGRKFTGRRCQGKKKEIRDGERGAVKINKRMSIEVSP